MQEKTGYVGRLAPSPTGLLHLGHVRTFSIAHRRAVAAGGVLRLRIDDLDPQRSRSEYVGDAMDDLRWLGLDWNGEPWFQSARMPAYREAWQKLVAGGWVYPCRCSRRELAAMASAPHEGHAAGADHEPLYPGTCRPAWQPGDSNGSDARAAWLANGPVGRNWRFRVPDGEIVRFNDGGTGPQAFTAHEDFADFAVWRRDDVPAYQLATVIDDAAMHVTEVVRGADLLLSTARQILLCRALEFAAPAWFHGPLAVDVQGRRLAKRDDALAVGTLRAHGVSAEGVLSMAEALPEH